MNHTNSAIPHEHKNTGQPWYRCLGIRAKLFIAFCGFAALTVFASLVAWLVFATIERSVDQVTQKSMPGIVDALALSKEVADISASAPMLATSNNREELALEQAILAKNLQRFVAVSQSLIQARQIGQHQQQIELAAAELETQLSALASTVGERLDLQHKRQVKTTAVQSAHTRFSETLEPLIDDAFFNLVINSEQVMLNNSTSVTNLVENGVSNIDELLSINAAANLAAGLIAEAVVVSDSIQLEPLKERFLSATLTISRNIAKLPDNPQTLALQKASSNLLDLGLDHNSVFTIPAGQPLTRDTSTTRQILDNRHDQLLLLLTPMIDDASFDLVMAAEQVTTHSEVAISGLIEGNVNTLSLVLTIRAEGNLVASLLSEGAILNDEILFTPLQDRFIATKARIAALLARAQGALYYDQLNQVVDNLLSLGEGPESLFRLRHDELEAYKTTQTTLDSSRAHALQLSDHVAKIVTQAKISSDSASAQSKQAIDTGQIILILITLTGLMGASIAMFVYVGPKIIQPISRITTAMTELSDGDTSIDIPARHRKDELGEMARALGVFRDNAVAVRKANLKEIQSTRRRLADAIESINEGFCFYDANDQLVVCNSRYRELLYPGVDHPLDPGVAFESIIRHTVSLGLAVEARGNEEAWIEQRLAKHYEPGSPHVEQRANGRYLMISERKTEDGGSVGVYSDITELKQRETELGKKSGELERIANQLSKYLSPQVYESIFTGRQEVKVESQRKKLTVFFSDIADFTETAEKLQSEDLTTLLNEYLTEMSKIAQDYGATIDKYVGDAIVIFFGDPETRGVQKDAMSCVEMAIAMRHRMVELRKIWWDRGIEDPLECRMGINTGYCTVGNFGSESRMDYTIIGAGVNLASRLETAAAHGEILVSYETYALVKRRVLCEERTPLRVKGINRPVATFEVIDLLDNLQSESQEVLAEHLNLRLEMNPTVMSKSERAEAEKTLRQALDNLTSQD